MRNQDDSNIRKKYESYFRVVEEVLDPTGRRSAKLCLTPFVYSKAFWLKMDRITRSYAGLLEFVFQEFPRSQKIQSVLEYPPDLERFINSLHIYQQNLAAARMDIFLTPSGFKMVESNCEIPGGNEESYFLEEQYLKIFNRENLKIVPRMQIVYDTLMHHYNIQAQFFQLPQKKKPTIYLAQWQTEIDRILGEYNILMDFIRQKGHLCGVIDPNEIIIKNNRAYTPSGEEIDLIYRRFTADELPKFARRKWEMAIEWDQARVVVVNPFCTKRVDSKNIMVLFKDESYDDVFPDHLKKELSIVRDIIPWTKKIKSSLVLPDGQSVDARHYLINNRENLVIKHANAYSSSAVFIGIDLDPRRWNEVVEESLAGDWVVQERIELPEMNIEYWEDGQIKIATCIYNVNPYIYDGKLGGFLNRASTDKLTSFKSGEIATVIPCFEKIKRSGKIQ
jgi:hypothetical protein